MGSTSDEDSVIFLGALGRNKKQKHEEENHEMGSSSGEKSELHCWPWFNEIDLQKQLDELQNKYNEKALALTRMLEEKDEIHRSFCEVTRKSHGLAREHVKSAFDEHELLNNELVNKKRRLESWSIELENKEKRLDLLRKDLKNREEVTKREKQKLEEDQNQKMKEINAKLQDLQDLNTQLVKKERQSSDELQEARKELIVSLMNSPIRDKNIRIKRMGEVNMKAFIEACAERYVNDDEELEEAELDARSRRFCSSWQEKLKDPNWHPFQIVKDSEGKKEQLKPKGDDKMLVELDEGYPEQALDAVTTAYKEIQEYNPIGRYAVPELWNFLENRKATLKEGISCMFKQLKKLRSRRD